MADPKLILASKFEPQHRFTNFGPIIVSALINGFRCVKSEINFEYPVTALSGFNGSGKSTIGQLLLCGYKKIASALNSKRYYVASWAVLLTPSHWPFDAI